MFGCAWCRYILYKVWIEISNFTKPTTKLCSTGLRQEAARATNEWRAKPKDKSAAQASAANAKRRAEQQKKEAELKQREARS